MVTLLGGQAMAASGPTLARPSAQMAVFAGFVALLMGARVVLGLTSLEETAVPLAAVPAAVAWRAGSRAAAVVAILAAAYAALGLAFDVTTFTVTLGGGLALALVCERGRWRRGFVAAGAAAVVQAALFGACVVLGGRPRSLDSVFAGLQTVLSGFLAGLGGMGAAALWNALRMRRRDDGPTLAPAEVQATVSV